MRGDVERAIQSAGEALTPSDLAEEAMPALARAVGADGYYFYEGCESASILGHHGIDFGAYQRALEGPDPMAAIKRARNPRLLIDTRDLTGDGFHQSPAYLDAYRASGSTRFMTYRLSDAGYSDPGLVSVFFSRSDRRGFSEKDARAIARVHDAFNAVTRRGARYSDRLRMAALHEVVLARDLRLALDADGRALWISDAALQLLDPRAPVPDVLRVAAQRLARSADGGSDDTSVFDSVRVPLSRAPWVLDAELYVARTPERRPFVVADLDDPGEPAALERATSHYGLTPTETRVLSVLATGCSNAEIARRTGTSIETARTHVRRILSKLGVSSRVNAALIAHGHPTQPDAD